MSVRRDEQLTRLNNPQAVIFTQHLFTGRGQSFTFFITFIRHQLDELLELGLGNASPLVVAILGKEWNGL